jgi:hypothetical protein
VYRQQLPSPLREARALLDKMRNQKGEVVYDDCQEPRAPRDPTQQQPSPNVDPRRRAPNQILDRNTKPWLDLLDCKPAPPCEAYPNRDNGCFGMCGPGCNNPCWWWICGDCCYHDFCAAHDTALRACEDVLPGDEAATVACAGLTLPPGFFLFKCLDLWPF